MSNLFKNWKTTSAGLLAIIGAVVGLAYGWHNLNPTEITAAASAILGGVGLIAAGDASQSIQTGDSVTTTANPDPHTVTKQ